MALGDWQYRQDDFLKGGGDPNAMLELLRGDTPKLEPVTDESLGPSQRDIRGTTPVIQGTTPLMATPGNYDLGRQNLAANRLLYTPEIQAMMTPGAPSPVDQEDKGPSQARIIAAQKVFSSDDFGIDQSTKSLLTGDPMPSNEEDKKRLAPLTTTLKDQAKKILDANVWSQFDPQMLEASGYGPTAPGGATGQTDAVIAQWARDNNLKLGPSYEALQQLGIEFPGTGRSAPVFQSAAPAKGVLIGKAVPATQQPAQAGPVDKTGLVPVIGSEFGEVDRPSRGGYTEPNWNVGAWGDDISGKDTKLAALPVAQLKAYGNPNSPDFAKKFNSQYDIQIVNPKTGQASVIQLGDKGPGASTGAGLDLTMGSRASIGLPENFKGPMQYRIVKKGSALPDGSTSTTSTTADAGSPATTATGPAVAYIQPLNPRELKDPAIYGEKNTTEDNMKWARHQADLYATEMAHAGTPIDTEEYKKHFDTFYEATQKKVAGEAPKQLDANDLDRFSTLTSSLTQMDAVLAAKKKAGGGGMMLPSDDVADFKAKRDLLLGIVAKGLGGNVGSLSDSDVKRVNTLLPNEWDSDTESERKITYLKNLTQQQMQSAIRLRKAGHYDTSGLEQEYFKTYPALNQAKQNQANIDVSAKIDKNLPQQPSPQPPQNQTVTPSASPAVPSHLPGPASSSNKLSLSGNEWWKKLKLS